LTTREELFSAANVLTHLGAAYVNDQNYGAPSQFIPEQIAIPWDGVTKKLKIVPARVVKMAYPGYDTYFQK